MKNAKCVCGADVTWSWGQDTFKVNGEYCEEVECCNPNAVPDTDTDTVYDKITVFRCPCGKVLGTILDNAEGMCIHNAKRYEEVDWFEDCNSSM